MAKEFNALCKIEKHFKEEIDKVIEKEIS